MNAVTLTKPARLTQKQSGLSLIELMIALVLGLLLIAGVINIFIGTQQTNRTQEALARVQETGRFAMEVLNRQAREAGMNGCPAGSVNNLLDPDGTGYDAASMAGSEPFSFTAPGGLAGHVRGQVLTINGSRRLDLDLTATGSGTGSGGNVPPINLANSSNGIVKGTIITVVGADGYTCDLFQTGSAISASNLQRSTNDSPGNQSVSEVRGMYSSFSGPVEVFEMSSTQYYIRNNPAGVPSLYSFRPARPGSPAETSEVVEGVFDLRLEYGLDTNGNGRVNSYVNHEDMQATQWPRAATVRIHLLTFNGEERQVLDARQTGLLFRNALFNAPNRRLYQVFTTTVAARNMVL